MIELLWNDPISEAKMAKYVETLELSAGQRVLDVGCGCGEVLIRLSERYQIQGTGIDSSAEHIAEAQRRAAERVSESQIRFVEADARTFHVDSDSIHLAVCIGATHAFGLGSDAYRNAIKQMIPLVAPGGLLLVAEGYMKQPATPEYRQFIGDSTPNEMTHAANVATGTDLGLTPLAAWTSTEDEWDEFEWGYQRVIEQKASERPDDRDVMAKLARRREWMDAYLQWGRDTLGYGVYLFKRRKD
jgi:ubiquinone/menaquinone biosynthesis C-methylase UbiE